MFEDRQKTTSQNIKELSLNAERVLKSLTRQAIEKRNTEKREPTFSIGRAAELLGITTQAIRSAEKDGRLPDPPRSEKGQRVNYTLQQLNNMRCIFNKKPWRKAGDEVAIISVQNFKGGVGKSTLSVNLAQNLAIKGYRVCLIDCDSQATATTFFGYVPDLDLDVNDTLYPFLNNDEQTSLSNVVRPTHFDGLSLIPSNLHLFQAEYVLAARMAVSGGNLKADRLSEGIDSIKDDFDVIIIDPPPALGAISLSALGAANGLVIPVPPTLMDIASTSSFLSMLADLQSILGGDDNRLKFLKFVCSRTEDEKKPMQRELIELMQMMFGRYMALTPLKNSAEIDNATARLMTVYEQNKPITSKQVRDRCLKSLDGVCSEVEAEILGIRQSMRTI